MLTEVKLVDGITELVVFPYVTSSIALQSLDFGYPEAREQTEARPDDDGIDDLTEFHGSSAVSIAVIKPDTARAAIDLLRWFARPNGRPWMYVADDEWTTTRRARLRGEQLGAPIEVGQGSQRAIQVAWRNPLGVWEAATETVTPISLSVVSSTGLTVTATDGLVVTAVDGLVVPGGSAGGSTIVTNLGTAAAHWVARIYGPATGPELTNVSTGQTIKFTDSLVLGSGEYLELDSRARTALLLSNSDASRLHYLSFADSSWWRLQPGENQVAYSPSTSAVLDDPVELVWRPAWI